MLVAEAQMNVAVEAHPNILPMAQLVAARRCDIDAALAQRTQGKETVSLDAWQVSHIGKVEEVTSFRTGRERSKQALHGNSVDLSIGNP
jgi:hypothetical protein